MQCHIPDRSTTPVYSILQEKYENSAYPVYIHISHSAPGSEYDYLRPRWTINIDMDGKWNIPVILIDFDCWCQNAVRLWPQNNTQRENVLILERTPLSTPSVSSISIDSSGYNTVF